MAGTPKIQLEGVAKAFGPTTVLDGVNLAIEPGESLAIIGQSGSGKSVTLKCILGLIRPDRGAIRVDGEEVVGLKGRALDRVAREVRHAVPGLGAVRFAAGVAQRHLRAHPGPALRRAPHAPGSPRRASNASASTRAS